MGKGSARTLKYWLDKGYDGDEAEKMRLSRIPGTREYFTIFKGMNKTDAYLARKAYNAKGSITLENMVKKYGETEGAIR
jgi:hypothetical protein